MKKYMSTLLFSSLLTLQSTQAMPQLGGPSEDEDLEAINQAFSSREQISSREQTGGTSSVATSRLLRLQAEALAEAQANSAAIRQLLSEELGSDIDEDTLREHQRQAEEEALRRKGLDPETGAILDQCDRELTTHLLQQSRAEDDAAYAHRLQEEEQQRERQEREAAERASLEAARRLQEEEERARFEAEQASEALARQLEEEERQQRASQSAPQASHPQIQHPSFQNGHTPETQLQFLMAQLQNLNVSSHIDPTMDGDVIKREIGTGLLQLLDQFPRLAPSFTTEALTLIREARELNGIFEDDDLEESLTPSEISREGDYARQVQRELEEEERRLQEEREAADRAAQEEIRRLQQEEERQQREAREAAERATQEAARHREKLEAILGKYKEAATPFTQSDVDVHAFNQNILRTHLNETLALDRISNTELSGQPLIDTVHATLRAFIESKNDASYYPQAIQMMPKATQYLQSNGTSQELGGVSSQEILSRLWSLMQKRGTSVSEERRFQGMHQEDLEQLAMYYDQNLSTQGGCFEGYVGRLGAVYMSLMANMIN